MDARAGGRARAGLLAGAALALLGGAGIGALAAWDGAYGHALQVKLLGPAPLLANDLPFLWTLGAAALLLGLTCLLAWARASGSWDRPALGLLALSLFADAVPGLYQFALALVVLVILERALRGRELPLAVTPLVFPLALILISYLSTYLLTFNFGATTYNLLYRSSYLLLVPFFPVILRSRRHLEILFHFLVIGALLSTAAAVVQLGLSFATQRPVTFAAEYNRVTTPFGVFPRCTGLMLHPNHQSNVLAPVAVMALYFATRPARLIRRAARCWYLAVYALLAAGVFLTWSRSGWLALGVSSLLVPLVRWPRFAPAYLAILGGVAALALESGAAGDLYDAVRELNAASADFRWHIDHIAVQSFLDRPWLGQGVSGMLDYYNPYHLHVHNTYLQILSEMGLLGAAGFALLFGLLAARLARGVARARGPWDRDWLAAVCLAATIILVQNLFAMFLWIKFLWAWIALLEASVFVCWRAPGREAIPPPLFLPEPAPPLLAHGS